MVGGAEVMVKRREAGRDRHTSPHQADIAPAQPPLHICNTCSNVDT